MCEACAASHTITYGYQPRHAVKEETSSDIMIFTFITFYIINPEMRRGVHLRHSGVIYFIRAKPETG